MGSGRRTNASFWVRFFFSLSALALLGLIYWSSTLIESEVKELHQKMRRLQTEVLSLRRLPAATQVAAPRPHIRTELPNLLKPDPYRTTTLPAQLPAGFRPTGTLRNAIVGKPQNIHPHSGWADVREFYSLCLVHLAGYHVGNYETFRPDCAVKIEEQMTDRGPEYWVHLREGLSWEPLDPSHFPSTVTLAPEFLKRHPVTAHDFKFGYDAVMNPHVQEPLATAMRPYYAEIEDFRVIDDLTFVVRWRAQEQETEDGSVVRLPRVFAWRTTLTMLPLPCFVYQKFADGTDVIEDGDYQHNSVWAQNFSQHWAKNVIVSCGPWLFDGMTDTEIRFRRNPNYYDPLAALTQKRVTFFRAGPDAVWQDFKAGTIDLFDSSVAPQKLQELDTFLQSPVYQAQPDQIGRVDYLGRIYRYVGWNMAQTIFASAKVRQALTMGIDRDRIIEHCLGSMGVATSGPFFPADPTYAQEVEPWPYDPLGAQQLLLEEGWADHDGDGVLDREVDGERQKLSFRLLYYTHSPTTRLMVDGIATSLKEIGVECRPVGLDVADLAAAFEGKDFDAISLAWALNAPPPECRQLWHSEGAQAKGSSNVVGFADPEVDALIESLEYEYDSSRRLELYHRFHTRIHEAAPYTFLYVPKVALLYRTHVQNVFVPSESPDLVPDGRVTEPLSSLFWLREDS